MRVTLIRHGQSAGNAGIPWQDLSATELTEFDRDYARSRLDARWSLEGA